MDAKLVVAKEEDIKEETKFQTLNQMGFVRAETAEYQWYLLVGEACTVSKLTVDETVRDYLATMLCRFTTRPELMEQLAAFDFYQHCLGITNIDSVCIHDIADICLQYVALFPERSEHRHEPRSLEYVSNIGTHLYKELAKASQEKDDWFSNAFQLMATSFGLAVMVLRSVLPRFAVKREVSQHSIHREGLHFLSVEELTTLAPALRNFSMMYFQSSVPQSQSNQ